MTLLVQLSGPAFVRVLCMYAYAIFTVRLRRCSIPLYVDSPSWLAQAPDGPTNRGASLMYHLLLCAWVLALACPCVAPIASHRVPASYPRPMTVTNLSCNAYVNATERTHVSSNLYPLLMPLLTCVAANSP